MRDILTYELTSEYYVDSFNNGNQTHVKEELGEMLFTHPLIAVRILSELPKDIEIKITHSTAFKKAHDNARFKTLNPY
jgi:hypothetical protein